VLLENGALPLDVVSRAVDAWIAASKIEEESDAG